MQHGGQARLVGISRARLTPAKNGVDVGWTIIQNIGRIFIRIIYEQSKQARFRQRQCLLHSLQYPLWVCWVTASDHVFPETDFWSQQCLVDPVGIAPGVLLFICFCYSAGLHFFARYPFHRRRNIAPNLFMEARLRKVPEYLLTRLDIRLTESIILGENTLINHLSRIFHRLAGMVSWFHECSPRNQTPTGSDTFCISYQTWITLVFQWNLKMIKCNPAELVHYAA